MKSRFCTLLLPITLSRCAPTSISTDPPSSAIGVVDIIADPGVFSPPLDPLPTPVNDSNFLPAPANDHASRKNYSYPQLSLPVFQSPIAPTKSKSHPSLKYMLESSPSSSSLKSPTSGTKPVSLIENKCLKCRRARARSSPVKHLPVESRSQSSVNEQRAAAVKEAFRFAWDGYHIHAFPHDELHPVTGGFGNSRNGWGASAVDALSTAVIMQMNDVVEVILAYIPKINYRSTDSTVSLFETTIRYLGGMLSGYDLLYNRGQSNRSAPVQNDIDSLLVQSIRLADALKFAFNTSSGVPYNELDFHTKSPIGPSMNILATVGTLVLEWTRLSDLSGNPEYGQLAQKAEEYLLTPSPPESQPFPGLLGTTIDINTGKFLDDSGGWGGGTDSFYEYLIKMYIYDPRRFAKYKDRWIAAVESSMKYLGSRPTTRKDLLFMANYHGQHLIKVSSHLSCFHAGNFILGGSVLKRQDIQSFGIALVESCHQTYTATVTKLGPEAFSWDSRTVPRDQVQFFNKHGFWIQSPYYFLRPEVMESYYQAFRITGDQKYREWAWEAFQALNSTTRTRFGFSAVENVNAQGGGFMTDDMESFLFAEVLKYSYLIFATDTDVQVRQNGQNPWVFNTEAHPLKVFGS